MKPLKTVDSRYFYTQPVEVIAHTISRRSRLLDPVREMAHKVKEEVPFWYTDHWNERSQAKQSIYAPPIVAQSALHFAPIAAQKLFILITPSQQSVSIIGHSAGGFETTAGGFEPWPSQLTVWCSNCRVTVPQTIPSHQNYMRTGTITSSDET